MTVSESIADSQARRDLGRLRWQRRWLALRGRLGEQCNDLVPTRRVLDQVELGSTGDLSSARDLGRQTVPLKRIVGSRGRAADFDLAFRPRRDGLHGRWLSIARARYQNRELPPVRLLKVGRAYFVEDGNHRVSVARALGQETIDAFVFEIDASGLEEKRSCTRLGYKA